MKYFQLAGRVTTNGTSSVSTLMIALVKSNFFRSHAIAQKQVLLHPFNNLEFLNQCCNVGQSFYQYMYMSLIGGKIAEYEMCKKETKKL